MRLPYPNLFKLKNNKLGKYSKKWQKTLIFNLQWCWIYLEQKKNKIIVLLDDIQESEISIKLQLKQFLAYINYKSFWFRAGRVVANIHNNSTTTPTRAATTVYRTLVQAVLSTQPVLHRTPPPTIQWLRYFLSKK